MFLCFLAFFFVAFHFLAAQQKDFKEKEKCLTDAKIISSLGSFLMNGFELLQH